MSDKDTSIQDFSFASHRVTVPVAAIPESGELDGRIYHFFFNSSKNMYNGHINKMKKTKTKMYITVIRCKATITPEIKLKEERLQN